MKGVVATGHALTSKAAGAMLSLGGNAFDAGIAAAFASVVTEPTLTSFGGGGFCLAHIEKNKEDILFDFFVNTPGAGNHVRKEPEMIPIGITFPGCTQVFHTGYSSVAVPGMLKGLLHIHNKLCTLPLKTIVKPSLSYLEEGIEVNKRQEIFLSLLQPIMLSSEYGRKMFTLNGKYLTQGDKIINPHLQEFFLNLVENGSDIYSGEIAESLVRKMEEHGGLITHEDLNSYSVIERTPLRIKYHDKEILTNPPPSLGGIKLALSLHLLESENLSRLSHVSKNYLVMLIELMKEMYEFSPIRNGRFSVYPFPDVITDPLIQSFRQNVSGKILTSSQGTTHISIIDEEGNALSMTTSNGSGSGCYIPDTGIMLNNMMGEDDLHPEGFFSSPPSQRVGSMMLPTMIMHDGKVKCVMGSGGSKRIRTAILQAIINIVDFHYPLEKAVEGSRVHFEDGTVHIEPGVSREVVDILRKHYKIHTWDEKDMYFGGVHCVSSAMHGWGDSRRGGSFLIVN